MTELKVLWEPWIEPRLIILKHFAQAVRRERLMAEAAEEDDEDDDDEEEGDGGLWQSMEALPLSLLETRHKPRVGSINILDFNNLGTEEYPIFAEPTGRLIHKASINSTYYDFFVGHTNIGITKEIAEKIEKSLGVESFEVHSPYRFLISIGKAFEFVDVMTGIERAISNQE